MTASDLAEALDCFWNAAIGESHTNSNIVGCIAVGFSAVATRLREISASTKLEELGGAQSDTSRLVKDLRRLASGALATYGSRMLWAADEIERLTPKNIPPGHVEIVTNGTRRIIPEGEPVFLLRARDKFAAGVVRHWAAVAQMGGVRDEQIQIARAHADKMDAWPTKQLPGSTKLAEEG